jgi:hypothetical protein
LFIPLSFFFCPLLLNVFGIFKLFLPTFMLLIF